MKHSNTPTRRKTIEKQISNDESQTKVMRPKRLQKRMLANLTAAAKNKVSPNRAKRASEIITVINGKTGRSDSARQRKHQKINFAVSQKRFKEKENEPEKHK